MTKISTKLGSRGQAVIPKPVRDELGLKPGDTLLVYTHEGHAHIEKPQAKAEWEAFFNAFPKRRLPKEFDFDALYEESYDE